MENERDYKEDIKIDENHLEKEWIEQASLYLYYAEAAAEASYEKDKRKSMLEFSYSKLYADVKEHWSNYFETKPTEPACKEWIITQKSYQKAEKLFIKATKRANILLNVKTAFDHRKKALENLVSLRIGGFYSEPSSKPLRNARQVQKRSFTKK